MMAPTCNSDKRMGFDSISQYSRQYILSDFASTEISFFVLIARYNPTKLTVNRIA